MPMRRSMTDLITIALMIAAVWILIGFYNASEFYRSSRAFGGGSEWWSVLYLNLIMGMQWALFTPVVVAIAERLPIDGRHRARNALLLLAIVPLIALIRCAVGAVVLQLGEGKTPTLAFIELSIGIRMHTYTKITVIIVGLTWLIDLYRDAGARERTALGLQTAVATAEAEHLRSELQPAFVLDTLRAVRERVRTDPEGSDHALVKLSDSLRRILDRERGNATVEEELVHTDRYIDLQRFRFDARIGTRTLIEEDVLAKRIPPLALETLVDAALSKAAPSWIELRGRAMQGRLRLEAAVRPSLHEAMEERGARLREWFGPECTTTLAVDGDGVVARVELPLEAA